MLPILQRIIVMLLALGSLAHYSFAAEPKYIIGFPEDNLSNEWRAAQMEEIVQLLKKHPNVQFLMADAEGSIAKNLLDIETLVEQGAQLLFLGPRHPDSLSTIVAKLRQKGVRIILLTRKLNTEDYDVFISPDDFKIAYDAATFLAEHMRGKGRILMLEGIPTTSTAIRRKKGFMAGLEIYPGIEVINRVANYSRTEAMMVVEQALKDGLKFDTIFAHNDAMAAGARQSLKLANIDPGSVPTVGIDFLPETRDAIINGEQLASFTYPTCGKIGVETALKLLQDVATPRYIEVPSQLVTRENVRDIKTVY